MPQLRGLLCLLLFLGVLAAPALADRRRTPPGWTKLGAVDGLLLSTYFHPDAPKPEIQKFSRDFAREFSGLTPSHREANAYDSLLLAAQALDKVGFDRAKVRAYLDSIGESTPAYEGVTGSFSPARRLNKRQPYLVRIRGGRFLLQD